MRSTPSIAAWMGSCSTRARPCSSFVRRAKREATRSPIASLYWGLCVPRLREPEQFHHRRKRHQHRGQCVLLLPPAFSPGMSLRTRICSFVTVTNGSSCFPETGAPHAFVQNHHRRDIAAVDSFDPPVEDAFGGVERSVHPALHIAFPIDQSPRANLPSGVLMNGGQRKMSPTYPSAVRRWR